MATGGPTSELQDTSKPQQHWGDHHFTAEQEAVMTHYFVILY